MTEQNIDNSANSDLLVKFLVGEADQFEIKVVEDWTSKSVENNKQLQDMAFILEQSAANIPPAIDEQSAWESLNNKIVTSGRTSLYRKIAWAATIAASALFVVLIARINQHHLGPSIERLPVAELTITTGDLPRTEKMPDGSMITMDPHSTIVYGSTFNKLERRIHFEGNAFFSIAHNPAKLFIIDVNDIRVTVMGTSFSIHSSSTKTTIDVATGVVRVRKKTDSVQLVRGQQLLILPSDSLLNRAAISTQLPVRKSTASSVDQHLLRNGIQPGDPVKQKQIIRAIINELLDHHLIQDRSALISFVLDDSGLYINDQKQPAEKATVFQNKYLDKKGNGFYIGPVKQTGRGFVFTMREVDKN